MSHAAIKQIHRAPSGLNPSENTEPWRFKGSRVKGENNTGAERASHQTVWQPKSANATKRVEIHLNTCRHGRQTSRCGRHPDRSPQSPFRNVQAHLGSRWAFFTVRQDAQRDENTTQTLSQGGGVCEFLGSLGRWCLTQRWPNQGGRPHRLAAEIYVPPMGRQAKAHGQHSDCFGWVGVNAESVSRLERDLVCLSHWRPVGAWALWLKNRPKVFKLSDSDHKIPRQLATVIAAELSEYRPWCGRM